MLAVIGAAAGVFATRLLRVNTDLPTAMVLGVLGAMVGGFGLRLVLTAGGWMISFVLALLGSLLVVWLWKQFRR